MQLFLLKSFLKVEEFIYIYIMTALLIFKSSNKLPFRQPQGFFIFIFIFESLKLSSL